MPLPSQPVSARGQHLPCATSHAGTQTNPAASLHGGSTWTSAGLSQGLQKQAAKGRPCSKEFSLRSGTKPVGETSMEVEVEGTGDSVEEIRGCEQCLARKKQ